MPYSFRATRRALLSALLGLSAAFLPIPSAGAAELPMATKMLHAEVNGMVLNYARYGEGSPIILLHGGLGAIGMFEPIIPILARDHEVIAVDLQGHGGTADIPRPLSFEAMADDVAALVVQLDLGKVDLVGYSIGGGVAMRMTIQHPDLVHRLVAVSAPFSRAGWHKENLEGMARTTHDVADYLKEMPLYTLYAAHAPRVQDWPVLLDKIAELNARDYDWSAEIRAIKAPTLLIYGDWDAVRMAHAVDFFALLGGGLHDALWDGSAMNANRLAVLPGATHYTIFADPRMAETALAFIDGR
ncbi:Pimeloyl-ACP methyl ester carboxylesterase [Pleomorphomonas diazotrophica]|nr:alpha/beta hydrolase [Pleomorphomonas diazotrophica]SFM95492.1 Pimeloyl-ACP methyl ester carboxylesterase [Pleomorphomonas diazotrophica]